MLSIRVADVDYNHELYQQTRELLKLHINQGDEPMLTEEGLLQLRQDNCLTTMLLITEICSTKEERVVGYSLFTSEFDMMFEDYGLFLDQLFIIRAFRGSGHSRKMLQSLCEEAKNKSYRFIKLYFQNALQVGEFYSHFGFKNITTSLPYIHFFEVYGHKEVKQYFDIDIPQLKAWSPRLTRNDAVICPNPNVHIWKLESNSPDTYFLITCKLPAPRSNQSKPEGNVIIIVKLTLGANALPGMFMMITLKQALRQYGITPNTTAVDMWKAVSRFQDSNSTTKMSVCAFLEKPSVCGWLGKILTFSNFTGDLKLIHKSIFKDRVISWSLKWPILMGVNFEVSVESEDSRNPLLNLLADMQISDESIQRGWNIAILNESQFDVILQSKSKNIISN